MRVYGPLAHFCPELSTKQINEIVAALYNHDFMIYEVVGAKRNRLGQLIVEYRDHMHFKRITLVTLSNDP